MRKLTVTVFSMLLFLAGAGYGLGADGKTVVVDMNRVLKSHPSAVKAKAQLDERLKEYEAERKQMMAEREKMKEAFDSARKAADNRALAEEQHGKMQDAAEKKQRELFEYELKMRKTFEGREKDLMDEDARISKKIIGEIREVIAGYAARKGYAMVLDSSAVSLVRIGTVVFADDSIDITEDILKMVGDKSEEKEKK
jgi:outer membrane protein